MQKLLILFIFCFYYLSTTFAQFDCYLSSFYNTIVKYNSSNCEIEYFTNNIGANDIAITPSGRLFGIDYNELFEIDIFSGNKIYNGPYFSSSLGTGINNLTALNDEYLLAISKNKLYKLKISDGNRTLIGTDSSLLWVSGDITYFKGYYYFSKSGKELARLKLNHSLTELISVESVGFMNTKIDQVWGLTTVGSSDCKNDNLKLLAFEDGITYEVNPENAFCTIYCDNALNITVTGATSIGETSNQIGLPEVSMPNIFTPNGDNINDYFISKSIVNTKKFEISIMNRWGNLLFESNDPDFKWDGKNNNDNECTEGDYFYIINYSDLCEKKHKLNGSFTLNR